MTYRRRAARGARRTWVAALLVGLTGCSAIRFDPEPEPVEVLARPRLAGAWTGELVVEGQRLPGTLELAQTGARLDATLIAPDLGGEASGGGEVGADGELRLELGYRTQCPGTLILNGRARRDALRLDGTLTATDCTGQATGTFSFTAR